MTPQKTIERFVEAWEKSDYHAMAGCCTRTWLYNNPRAAETLRNMGHYRDWTPQGFDIVATEPLDNPVFPDGTAFVVTVALRLLPPGRALTITKTPFVVVCERGPYDPGIEGVWGINPINGTKRE